MSDMIKERFLQDANLEDPTSFGQCGDHVYWKTIDGVLYIGGTGDMWDYPDAGDAPDSEPTYLRKTYEDVEILEGVTSIGSMAFCEDIIHNITIPKSVKTIKECAFFNCIIYNRLKFTEAIQTLESDVIAGDPCGVNTLVLSVNIPNIMVDAFYNRNLAPKKIILTGTLPDDVTPIVQSQLFEWPAVSRIYYPKSWDAEGKTFYERIAVRIKKRLKTREGDILPEWSEADYQQLEKALIPYEA